MDSQNPASQSQPEPTRTPARTEAGGIAVTPAVAEPSVDNGIEESFPASDPVSVSITKVLVASDDAPNAPLNPADEAAPGTPGTGENVCPVCGGSGRVDGGECEACGGTGQVTVGIGGACAAGSSRAAGRRRPTGWK